MDKKINNNGYDYVDLGLPSRTLWATCNVGASNPSDFGLYFQWGDVQGYTAEQIGTKKRFANDFSDYKWHLSGDDFDNDNFTKYKTEGATLDLEDDAAHVNMGGSWHMPTPTQIQELTANTTSTWTTQDGVNGRLFTSKKNGKSIFIPAAGYVWNGSLIVSGSYGYVWSSMLSTSNVDYGQNLSFNSDNVGLYNDYHYDGFSVRGVLDKSALKVSDSHKDFELKDKVLIGIAFNIGSKTMKKVYCCKEGGKRFGKTCLTNGCRGSNGFCQYASELTKEEAEATAERVRKALKGE